MNLVDWASQNKPAPENDETLSEKLARLEADNARLAALAKQNEKRAEEAEDGWHGALLKLGRPGNFTSDSDPSLEFREQRSDHAVLVSLATLAEEQVTQLKHVVKALQTAAESRNMVEIDSNGSAGKIKVRVRCTGETLADAHADALEQFAQAMAEVEAGSVNGWSATVEMLQAKKGEA